MYPLIYPGDLVRVGDNTGVARYIEYKHWRHSPIASIKTRICIAQKEHSTFLTHTYGELSLVEPSSSLPLAMTQRYGTWAFLNDHVRFTKGPYQNRQGIIAGLSLNERGIYIFRIVAHYAPYGARHFSPVAATLDELMLVGLANEHNQLTERSLCASLKVTDFIQTQDISPQLTNLRNS